MIFNVIANVKNYLHCSYLVLMQTMVLKIILYIVIILVPNIAICQSYENQMLAGIDVGGKSAKLTIVKQINGKFTTLLDSNIVTNVTDFTPHVIENTVIIVTALYNIAALYYNVQRNNIYIVLSSGVVNIATATKNRAIINGLEIKLEAKIPNLINKVQAISSQQESMFTFLGQIPKEAQKNVCSLNIGSSNTIFGNLANENNLLYRSFFYNVGTKVLTNTVGMYYDSVKTLSEYARLVSITANAICNSYYKKEQFLSTGFESKNKVILNGGICWALINIIYPNNFEDDEITLKIDDLDNFINNIKNKNLKKGELKTVIESKNLNKLKLIKFNKLLNDINKVYNERSIIAGAFYLKQLLTDLKLLNPQLIFNFIRDSNNAWIKGFLMYGSSGKNNEIQLAN